MTSIRDLLQSPSNSKWVPHCDVKTFPMRWPGASGVLGLDPVPWGKSTVSGGIFWASCRASCSPFRSLSPRTSLGDLLGSSTVYTYLLYLYSCIL